MLLRFAAASAVASIAVSVPILVVGLAPSLTFVQIYPLLIIWCLAPLAWGVWALLAPTAWVPGRLPLWGAILGIVAGLLVMFVLNLPARIFGQTVSVVFRGVAVLVLCAFYCLLWMLVRAAYRSLLARGQGQ